MTKSLELQSPTEDILISPTREHDPTKDEKIKMKKHMGLMEGVAIILGIIFGSGKYFYKIWQHLINYLFLGIFISPKGIIEQVDSIGFSLIVWVLCGILSMIGALCYAELGTSIPESGGDYAYINKAFGPLPSFLYLWAANVIFV